MPAISQSQQSSLAQQQQQQQWWNARINIDEGGDLAYEEELVRNPCSLRHWLRFVEYKLSQPQCTREDVYFVYERGLKELPGSYKLWKQYLDLRQSDLKGHSTPKTDAEFVKVNYCFERALMLLNKMPRIWLDYLGFLLKQPIRITLTRRVFDRALRALPVMQHARIWEKYVGFAKRAGGETCYRIFRRLVQFSPEERREDFIELLIEQGRYKEAMQQLVKICDDSQLHLSLQQQQQQTLAEKAAAFEPWRRLCELLSEHPTEASELPVETILRVGVKRYPEHAGKIWCCLAQFWILQRQFELARNVYEEAIRSALTVRDFTQVFDAYAQFEESVLTAEMNVATSSTPEDTVELDLKLARLERLMERRPFLVNDVLLRQNPHNVTEWRKRVQLCGESAELVIKNYENAINTVNPKKAQGELHRLWIEYALWWEQREDLIAARETFEKATLVNFKQVSDLAEVWCEWAEMELRQGEYQKARQVMGMATSTTSSSTTSSIINYHDESLSVQQRVHKALRLWCFYVDLEESLGTVESTKVLYDRILQLRIANAETIVNYANFLQEHGYHEDSFRVYEQGIEIFGYPIAFELWNVYLTRFVERYGGTKMERARDLFEQALANCPARLAKPLYLLYGQLEEEFGLAKHALRVYNRATEAVADEEKLEMYRFYLAKVAAMRGVAATRDIYERAIKVLPDQSTRELCLSYAEMERRLGEIDRARAIYAYGSQFCDPRTVPQYWQTWHDFEVRHGNEDTFKEMLRIKRSVQAQYNTEVSFISAQLLRQQQQQQQQQKGQQQGQRNPLEALEMTTAETIEEEIPAGGAQHIEIDESDL